MNAKTPIPRFVADVMLGKLSRWLRVLGFDTAYFRAIDDNDLIRIALQQQRTLLTRDTGIVRRHRVPAIILVHSNDTFGQLKELISASNIIGAAPWPDSHVGRFQPRCTLCNGELTVAAPESIADRVPEYVLLNAAPFFTCRECGKVYWYGSHIKSIDAQLKIILGEIAAHWKNSEKD